MHAPYSSSAVRLLASHPGAGTGGCAPALSCSRPEGGRLRSGPRAIRGHALHMIRTFAMAMGLLLAWAGTRGSRRERVRQHVTGCCAATGKNGGRRRRASHGGLGVPRRGPHLSPPTLGTRSAVDVLLCQVAQSRREPHRSSNFLALSCRVDRHELQVPPEAINNEFARVSTRVARAGGGPASEAGGSP
jgi:hypothetical protein